MKFEAPIFFKTPEPVKPEWIDYNGHMNVAYYVKAFDEAVDKVNKLIGLGPDYLKEHNCSTFALDARIKWLKEMRKDDQMQFKVHLLDNNEKCILFFLTMIDYKSGNVVATYENLLIHIDMSNRKPSDFKPEIRENIDKLLIAHKNLIKPTDLKIKIGIKK